MDEPNAAGGVFALRRAVTDVIGFTDLHREMVERRSHVKALEYQALAAAECLRLGVEAEAVLPLMLEAAPAPAKIIKQMRARIATLALTQECLMLDDAAQDSDNLLNESARAWHSEAVLLHGTKLAQLILDFTRTLENDDE